MKKATTIEELYDIFDYTRYLSSKDHAFFVNLYEDELKQFAAALKINKDMTKLFLIAGQSGNGKSSILHNITLTFPERLERLDFHYLDGREVFLYDDIDIIDILLMLGYRIVKDDAGLTTLFQEKLKRIEGAHDGSLQEERLNQGERGKSAQSDAKGSIGVKLLDLFSSSLGFEASYKMNDVARTSIRQFFQVKKSELIILINEIVLQYKTKNRLDKSLVMVIDDLEKKENVDHIFTKDLYLLKQIEMVKIITVPIYLKRDHYFADTDIREFSLALYSRDRQQQNEKSHAILAEVIDKRIETSGLLTPEAKEMAIELSGGNLRQLIKLINIAAETALTYDAFAIDKYEMGKAKERITRDLSSLVMPKAKFLDYIKRHKMIDPEEQTHQQLLSEATKSGLVYAYFNGITWYDINPLIDKVIEEYLSGT